MAKRQRQKYKPLQVELDAWARTGNKRCNTKTGQR